MINRVVLVGRITKDPMMRKTQSGTSVISFILAANRRMKDQEQQALIQLDVQNQKGGVKQFPKHGDIKLLMKLLKHGTRE